MSNFKSFNETMAAVYVGYYNEHGEQKTFDFVLKNSVSLYVLNALYDSFILDGIDDITKVSQDKKTKYWEVACKYFTELPERLKASKAAYVLDLITAN